MKKYNKYMDSGIDWLGEIPSHWKTTKFKYIISDIGSGATPTSGDARYYISNGMPWVAISDMSTTPFITRTEKSISEEAIKDKGLTIYPSGTLLYSIYATIGKVSELRVPATINQAILALKFNNMCDNRYMKYLLGAMEDYATSLCSGNTQLNLNAEKVLNFECAIPPKEEQETIAMFLDEKLGYLSRLIENKEQLIEELNNYKTSIITETVTKGLNPQTMMKETGNKWIQEIPQHWSISKLKHVVSCNDEVLPEDTSKDATINYVEISDVDYIDGITGFFKYSFSNAPSRARRVTRPKDVIISTVRTYLKAIAQITETNLIVSTGFAVLRAKGINPDFLSYAVKSHAFIEAVIANSVGVSYPAITASELIDISIPIPPESEQIEISEYLKQKNNLIDQYIKEVEQQINNLGSYKSSIINEAVTGKIDLRDWTPKE